MCGISFFCCIDHDCAVEHSCPLENKHVIKSSFLKRRGPDVDGHVSQQLWKKAKCLFSGYVLHMRGYLTEQPVVNTHGDILLWNGEIFGGMKIGENENDTLALFDKLTKCLTDAEVCAVVQVIQGPWALIFWQNKQQKLWFGRDVLGRRSLQWHLPGRESKCFSLSSVAVRGFEFKEVPAVGLFCMSREASTCSGALDGTLSIQLDIFPWQTALGPWAAISALNSSYVPNTCSSMTVRVRSEEPIPSWMPVLNKQYPDECRLVDYPSSMTGASSLEILTEVIVKNKELVTLASQLLEVLERAVRKRVFNLPRPEKQMIPQCKTSLHQNTKNKFHFKDLATREVEEGTSDGLPFSTFSNLLSELLQVNKPDLAPLSTQHDTASHTGHQSASIDSLHDKSSYSGVQSGSVDLLQDKSSCNSAQSALLNLVHDMSSHIGVQSTLGDPLCDIKNDSGEQSASGDLLHNTSHISEQSLSGDLLLLPVTDGLYHDEASQGFKRQYEPKIVTESFPANVAVLFSGGVDSAVLAALADRCVPANESIDLINVAFEQKLVLSSNRKMKRDLPQAYNERDRSFNVPDRCTGYLALSELNSCRQWNFVEVNVSQGELEKCRDEHIRHLLHPLNTVLDDSIGCAVWFAARGAGILGTGPCKGQPYTSKAKVILCGMGADEQLAGYSRHRVCFKQSSWAGLNSELEMEINRISARNLGRDDRIIADHGKESRYPYLDEDVMTFLSTLPVHYKADLRLPRGVGEKLLLRLAAHELELFRTACLPKRAIQFGSRIAKMEQKKEKGNHVCQRLVNE